MPFHRRICGALTQTGCPFSRTGTGGRSGNGTAFAGFRLRDSVTDTHTHTNSAIVEGEKLFVSDVLVALLVVDPVSGVIMVWDIMETVLVCIGAKYHLLLAPERKE